MANNDWVDVDENWVDVNNNLSPMEKFRQYINTAPQRAEQGIADRPSVMANLIQDPTTMSRFLQHPLGTSLRTLGGAWELAEGIPSDVLMKLNRPEQIIPDIQKTITGQRPAQVGDFLRSGGIPEPLATLGGLAITGMKGTPTEALGRITTAPVVSLATSSLKQVIKMGSPAIAKVMQFLTGKIPPEYAKRALTNPDILSPKLLEKEGEIAGSLYKKVIQPLRDNPKAIVNLQPVQERILQENLINANGEWSPEMHKMKQGEFNLIQDWLSNIGMRVRGKVKTTWNDTESLISRIDSQLGKFYKAGEKSKLSQIKPQTEPFTRVALIIRNSLSNAMKNQFPEAAPVIKRYHNYILDKNVANSFKGISGSFFKALPARMAILSLGVKSPIAALAAFPLTMPVAWRGLIGGGANLGNIANQHPEMLIPAIRKSIESNQGDWVNVD